MVNTRRSGPISPNQTPVKGKNAAVKSWSSDPSGVEPQTRSKKRQSGHNDSFTPGSMKMKSGGRQVQGKPAKNGEHEESSDILSPPETRSRSSTRRSLEDRNNSSAFPSERHTKGGRTDVSSRPRKMQSSSRPRRSDRQRRNVYETLNENILKQQQLIPSCDNLFVDEGKGQEETIARDDSPDAGSDEGTPVNMYDLIKKKHDTPSPEKRRKSHSRKHLESDGDDEEEDSDDEAEEEDEEDEEEGEGDDESQSKRYLLRQKRPVINRYTAPPMKTSRERRNSYVTFTGRVHRRREAPLHASPVRRIHRRRRNTINKGSSTSSSDESHDQDERKFERRKSRSMAKARERCLPMNFVMEDLAGGALKDRRKVGSSLADVDPMNINRKVTFESVGGLRGQIRALKEMILFPLMYTEVFEKFKITPPRGVLFHGPPGTGKTLVARALANECSKGGKKVAFFMRKGADCLSKWVGESERQLRLLFDQAFSMRPSIIFFDEIDGLAPVRSSRQDQIHSSIVSTLLALMDGLDNRGEIVVIGATNRIDAIDPALRRPGRFDREFQFPLPDKNARRAILSIHTQEWEPKLLPAFVDEMADRCVGYCGADIKALCTEAALLALRRRYPQIYGSEKKLLLDVDSIEVTARDFDKAMKMIVPASQRSVASPARMLSSVVRPLLSSAFHSALDKLKILFPPAHVKSVQESHPCAATENPTSRVATDGKSSTALSEEENTSDEEGAVSIFEPRAASSTRSERYTRRMRQRVDEQAPSNRTFFSGFENPLQSASVYRPRFLICGKPGMGQSTHVAPALLHATEHVALHCLDLPTLYGVASKTPEEACAQSFREARRTAPCVLYMPHLDAVWASTTDSLHCTFMSLLQDLPPLAAVLLLATADKPWGQLPAVLQQLFSRETGQVVTMTVPNCQERTAFFQSLFLECAMRPPKPKTARKERILEVLPVAPTPPPRQLTELELKKVREDEENTLRELRIFLREIHTKLIMDRRFKEFSKPVDLEEITDYLEVVDEPMDLSTMMQKINSHRYMTCAQYLRDIDLITNNALKYNPDRQQLDKLIRHRACELRDLAHSAINSQLEPEFEKACEDIIASRERRGEERTTGAPAYVSISPEKSGCPNSEPPPPSEEKTEVSSKGDADTREETDKAPQATGTQPKKRASRRLYVGKSKRRRLSRRELHVDAAAEQDGDEEEDAVEDAVDDTKQTDDTKGGRSNAEGDKDAHAESHQQHEEENAASLLPISDDELLRNGEVDSVSAMSEVNFVGDDDDVALLCDVDEHSDSKIDESEERIEHRISRANLDRHVHDINIRRTPQVHLPNGICVGNDGQSTSRPHMEPGEERSQSKNITVSNGTVGTELNDELRHKLKQLLCRLVDATHSSPVESLERYHSALQQCIYQHRHSQDQAQLAKELERMVHTFSTSLKNSR